MRTNLAENVLTYAPPVKAAQTPLDDLLAEWVASDALPKNTARAYLRHVRGFLSCAGDKRLADLDGSDVSAWLVTLPENARQQACSAVKRFGRWLGATNRNAHTLGQGLRTQHPERVKELAALITFDELARLRAAALRTARPQRNDLLICLLFYCGPRVGELATLTWSKVTDDCDFITVTGKGRKVRTIETGEGCAALLRAYRAERKAGSVFGIGAGHMFTVVRACAKAAGIKRWASIGPHSFRHANITHGLDVESLDVVQRNAGHSNGNTTAGYALQKQGRSVAGALPWIEPMENQTEVESNE